MLLDGMAMILAATAISLVPGGRAAPCPNGTVAVNLTSSGDMQALVDAMNCTGAGVYDATLHGRLQIGEILEVSEQKSLTVTGYVGTATGSASDTNSVLGSTSDSYAVLDAGNTTGIFLVSEGSTLTINKLILEGGYSGDGAAIAVTSSSTLKVFVCDFTNNTVSMSGGAISANDHSNIYIDGRTYFGDNWAYLGGAISASHSNIYMNGSTTFRRNFADSGGAIFANYSDIHINGNTECDRNFPNGPDAEDSYLSETNIKPKTMFVHNSARHGGGIHAVGGSIICCAGAGGTVFLENEALDDGGALSLTAPTKVNIASVLFFSNTAYRGGAIYTISTNFGIEAVYQSCVFRDNYATDGGATYLNGDAQVYLVNGSYFVDNHAGTSGGAVYLAGSLKLFRSAFDYNRAGRDGVAISGSCASSLVEFENVTFRGNGMLCPLGQYEPTELDSDAAAFAKVCEGCSSDETAVPAGILDREWQLPSCEELPTGTVAVHDGTTTRTLSLAAGYYRDSATSVEILECYRHEACVGGNVVENYCADGYEGAYCSVCSRGYSSGIAHGCRKCPGYKNTSAVAILMAAAIAVFLAAVAALRRMGKEVAYEEREGIDAPQAFVRPTCSRIQGLLMKALPLTAIKIVVVVWQIIFQFAAVAEDVYPKEYETFLSVIRGVVNLDLSVIGSYSCLFSTNYHGSLLLATILPSLALAILAISYHDAKGKYPISSQQRLTVWSRHLSAGLVVVFYVYSSIASTILQAFSCQYIDGDWYLRADYKVSCESRTHKGYMIYAVAMSIVYPLGIPALFCWWLVRNRKYLKASDRKTIDHLEPYSGIWDTYKPSRYYYEVVEYFRRLAISVSSVFLIPNSVNNIAVILTLTGVFMFVSESLSPFESNLDMGLYRWGNGVVMASMFVALLNTADASDDESLSVFGWVLIIVNVVMIVAVVAEAVALVRKFRGQLESNAE